MTGEPVTLEPRTGPRPEVSVAGPQTQLSQRSSPELWWRLGAAVFALPDVEPGPSQVSPASSRAVFLLDQAVQRAPETSLAPGRRLEPVHLHGDYGTEFLVYGPRDDHELRVVLALIAESLTFARG